MLLDRLKAFVIDLFMIYTPILYITTYIILGSAEAFRQNQLAILGCVLVYACIDSLFCSIASQTPGMKAQNLSLQTLQNQKVPFLLCFLRFLIWLCSLALLFGFVFPFLRKDRLCFHDYICKTKITKIALKP